jgi:hypothetical protein
MPNCKPGQLAIVIGAITPGLEGRIVEILKTYEGEKVEGVPWDIEEHEKLWWVTSPHLLPVQVLRNGELLRTVFCKERAIDDIILYPINDTDVLAEEELQEVYTTTKVTTDED